MYLTRAAISTGDFQEHHVPTGSITGTELITYTTHKAYLSRSNKKRPPQILERALPFQPDGIVI